MIEVIFLFSIALIWITFAVIQDLRTTEIANWLNFSLIIFAMGFRFFYSLFSANDFSFFYQGLIGLGIFALLGNLLYFGRVFAGGDAKLMIALGAVLPFSESFLTNITFSFVFLVIFLFTGAVYSLATSLILSLRNFKAFSKEFSLQIKNNKKFILPVILIAILLLLLGFFKSFFLFLGILVFILPYLYIYSKAVDEACMIKKVNAKELMEGDWLYKGVKVGKKTIKANWDGLTKQDIALLKKKHKTVLIRRGVAFSPVFLISFLILLYLFEKNIWNFLF